MALRSALLMSLMLASCLALASADYQHDLAEIEHLLEAKHDSLVEAEGGGALAKYVAKYLPLAEIEPLITEFAKEQMGDMVSPEKICSSIKSGAEGVLKKHAKGWFGGMIRKAVMGHWDMACGMLINVVCAHADEVAGIAGAQAQTVKHILDITCSDDGMDLIQQQNTHTDLERWATLRYLEDPNDGTDPRLSEIDELLASKHDALVQVEGSTLMKYVKKYLPIGQLAPFLKDMVDPDMICPALKQGAESILGKLHFWGSSWIKKGVLKNWDAACPMVKEMACSHRGMILDKAGEHGAELATVLDAACGEDSMMLMQQQTSDLERWALVSTLNQLTSPSHQSEDSWNEDTH